MLQLEHEPLTVEQASRLEVGQFLFVAKYNRSGIEPNLPVQFYEHASSPTILRVMGINGEIKYIDIDALRLPISNEMTTVGIDVFRRVLCAAIERKESEIVQIEKMIAKLPPQ